MLYPNSLKVSHRWKSFFEVDPSLLCISFHIKSCFVLLDLTIYSKFCFKHPFESNCRLSAGRLHKVQIWFLLIAMISSSIVCNHFFSWQASSKLTGSAETIAKPHVSYKSANVLYFLRTDGVNNYFAVDKLPDSAGEKLPSIEIWVIPYSLRSA